MRMGKNGFLHGQHKNVLSKAPGAVYLDASGRGAMGWESTHVLIGAVHGGAARGINPVEIDGAVLGVVVHRPDTGAGLHAGLVTIGIKSRR